jgi:hypothetical protein
MGGEPAEKNALCLACHATDAAKKTRGPDFSVNEGVGCESCHGPAGDWIELHTRAAWKTLPAAEKNKLQFIDNANLAERARRCVVCHVGTPAAEVNHDLIAGGHPRLAFELSAYLDRLPKHWGSPHSCSSRQENAAQTWAVGQAVAAAAFVRLSTERRPTDAAIEFSHYDCFACHHALGDEPWRRERQQPSTTFGQPQWGSWYLAYVGNLFEAAAPNGQDELDAMDTLEKRMSFWPGAAANRRLGQAAIRLERWADELAAAKPDDSRLESIRAMMQQQPTELTGWDHAAQVYLTLSAIGETARANELRLLLQFPEGWQSPRGFVPASAREAFDEP